MLEHKTDEQSEDVRVPAVTCWPLCIPQVCSWEDGGDPRGIRGRPSRPDRYE